MQPKTIATTAEEAVMITEAIVAATIVVVRAAVKVDTIVADKPATIVVVRAAVKAATIAAARLEMPTAGRGPAQLLHRQKGAMRNAST